LTNNLSKLNNASDFEKKLDASRATAIIFLQFIEGNAARLRFSQLFEYGIVQIFYAVRLGKGRAHLVCTKFGLIHKVFRQSVKSLLVETEGLSKFSGT
jgi:hypothetical protein